MTIINHPGRNDPCPCGSGKKYKKCCFLKIQAVEADNVKYLKSIKARWQAKDKIYNIGKQKLDIRDLDIIDFLLNSPIFEDKEINFIFDEEHALFFKIIETACKIFAYPVNKKNIFLWKYCLDEHRDAFNSSELKFLESIKQYVAGFFQVKGIESQNYMTTFEDIFTGKIYKTKDKKLSQDVVKHDILGGFLIPFGDIYIIEGVSPTIFSPTDKGYIRDTVLRLYKAESKRPGRVSDKNFSRFLNQHPVSIYRLLLDHKYFISREHDGPPSKLHTRDGNEFILLNSYYKITGRKEIKRQLLSREGFKLKKEGEEIDEIEWSSSKGIILGDVYIAGNKLIFLTDSREHLKKWEKLIKGMPLELIKTEEVDQEKIIGRLVDEAFDSLFEQKPREVPVEEFRKSAISKWESFYDSWWEQKYPFMGNKSPAELASTKAGRQRVSDLIDSIENVVLRLSKNKGMDNAENNLKYFNADKLRKKL